VAARSRFGRDRFLFFVAFVVRTAFPRPTSADTSNVQRTRRPSRDDGTVMLCFDTAIRFGDGRGNSSASGFSRHITRMTEQTITRQSESFQKAEGRRAESGRVDRAGSYSSRLHLIHE
jgi:hypothetical protein